MLESRPRLLIIDDDVFVMRVYKRLLGRAFDVLTETDAKSGLRRIDDGETLDVILCDRNLQEMSGQDFFEELGRRSRAMQSRVVICSGLPAAVDDAFAHALGDRYFLKVGGTTELLALLLRVAAATPPTTLAAA